MGDVTGIPVADGDRAGPAADGRSELVAYLIEGRRGDVPQECNHLVPGDLYRGLGDGEVHVVAVAQGSGGEGRVLLNQVEGGGTDQQDHHGDCRDRSPVLLQALNRGQHYDHRGLLFLSIIEQ